MPEQSLTLLIAAALATAILALRALQPSRRRTNPSDVDRNVERMLEQGGIDAAIAWAARSPGDHARVALRVLGEAEKHAGSPSLRAELEAAFDAGHRACARQSGGRQARDAFAITLFAGAAMWVASARDSSAGLFHGLSAVSGVLLLRSIVVERAFVRASARSRAALVHAIFGHASKMAAPASESGAPCSRCGDRSRIIVDVATAKLQLGAVGAVRAIFVCAGCGLGTFEADASAIPIGEVHGTRRAP